MADWMKSIIASLCIMTILMHLIPKGKFSGYVRFYAGLFLFLMAAEPAWEFLTGEDRLEQLIQLEFLKEDYYNLETSVNSMEELKNDSIQKSYQEEIQRQMIGMAQAYGLEEIQLEVEFGENGYTIDGVEIRSLQGDLQNGALDAVCQEIAGVYSLEQENLRIQSE